MINYHKIALTGIVAVQIAFFPGTNFNQSVIADQTNNYRTAQKVQTLQVNDQLTKAAQAKADDMAVRGYFAHNTPDGKTPWTFIAAAGYQYQTAGENLAVDFVDSKSLMKAWENSPSHNRNLLDKNFTEIGVGIAKGKFEGHTAIFVVQEFAAPKLQLCVPSH